MPITRMRFIGVAWCSWKPAACERAPADDNAGYGDDQSGDGKQPDEDVAGWLIAQQNRQIVVVQEVEQPAVGARASVAEARDVARRRIYEQPGAVCVVEPHPEHRQCPLATV